MKNVKSSTVRQKSSIRKSVYGTIVPSGTQAQSVTLQDVMLLWLEHNRIKLKEQTYAKYHQLVFRHIVPALGTIPMQQITTKDINQFLYEKSCSGRLDGTGGLSAGYVRTMAFILKSATTFAAQYCAMPPMTGHIALPVKLKSPMDVLSFEEQARLEAICWQHASDKDIAILFSLYTGMRLGEVCGLAWQDINCTAGTVQICHTVERVPLADVQENTPTDTHSNANSAIDVEVSSKSKTRLQLLSPKSASSHRIIPLPSKLLPLLIAAQEQRHDGFLIQGKQAAFADPRTLQYFFQKRLTQCNVRSVNYHILRHTFATRCIEAGMDAKSLSELLGHASVTITMGTYVHSSMEHKRKQLEDMTAFTDTALSVYS